jgi:glyoxylase-like metal-dependent hydrolase (beta-lactamase superfamily II)
VSSVTSVDVRRIAGGLWRWTAYHTEWEEEVGSIYWETGDGVVVIDPIVPSEDNERFWRAFDRDVERAGGAVHIFITVFWHVRDVAELRDRYSASVWAVSRGRGAIERRVGTVTDSFRPGDELPGGLVAFGTARAAEVVYWIPEHRAVVPGDVLLGEGAKGGGTRSAGPGGLRMCPGSWLPEGKTHAQLADSLRPLLDLPVERVLVSHGEPVLAGGRDALAAALATAS